MYSTASASASYSANTPQTPIQPHPVQSSNSSGPSRVHTFQQGVQAWVELAPTPSERQGRQEAGRRVALFLQKTNTSPFLNWSGLGLTSLPSDIKLLAQLATLRGAPTGSKALNLENNPLGPAALATLGELPPSQQGHFVVSAPALSADQARDWVVGLGAVVQVLNQHTTADMHKLAESLLPMGQHIDTTWQQVNAFYGPLQTKTNANISKTTASAHLIPPLPHFNVADPLRNAENLFLHTNELSQLRSALQHAKARALHAKDNVPKAQARINQLMVLSKFLGDACLAVHTLSTRVPQLTESSLRLADSLNQLRMQCLQAERDSLQAPAELNSLFDLLLEHTTHIGKHTEGVRDLQKQLTALCEFKLPPDLDLGLINDIQAWAQRHNSTLENLHSQKSMALLLARLANPKLSTATSHALVQDLQNHLAKLPASSPFWATVAQHPNPEVQALAPRPQPSNTPLRRTPSQTLLEQHPPVNTPATTLAKVRFAEQAFEAAKQGDLPQLHSFLSRGLDPHITDAEGNGLLHTAAAHGQLTLLRWLASQQQLPLEAKNQKGETPLLVAAKAGHVACMAALKDPGANTSTKDKDGDQAIHLAARVGTLDTVKFCITELQQSLEIPGFNGRTPLLQAAAGGKLDTLRWLVDQGANTSTKDKNGNQPIHHAAYGGHLDAVKFCITELQQSLETPGFEGRTPLLQAAAGGKLDTLRWLVEQGGNKAAKDKDGDQAIHLAARVGTLDTVKFCITELQQGLETPGFNGHPPLLLAAAGGKLDTLRWLVAQGANISAKNIDGNQAIHLAARFGTLDAVKFCVTELQLGLETPGYNGRTPLLQAAAGGKLDTLHWLVGQGANKAARDSEGCQAIHLAARFGTLDAVKLCATELQQGLETPGFYGRTPLLHAAAGGKLDTLRWLVERGGNKAAKDSRGLNALQLATRSRHSHVVEFLKTLPNND